MRWSVSSLCVCAVHHGATDEGSIKTFSIGNLLFFIRTMAFMASSWKNNTHYVTGKKIKKLKRLQTLSWILSSHCMTGSRVALSISVVRRKQSCNTWDAILFYHVNVLFNHCEFVNLKTSKMSALSKPKICFSSVWSYDTSDDGSQVVAGKGSNAERLARATDI